MENHNSELQKFKSAYKSACENIHSDFTIEYLKSFKSKVDNFYFYKSCGKCHLKRSEELFKEINYINYKGDVKNLNGTDDQIFLLKEKADIERANAQQCFKQCLLYRKSEEDVSEVFYSLCQLCQDSKEIRRYLIALYDSKYSDVKEWYKKVNQFVINCFDIGYDMWIGYKEGRDEPDEEFFEMMFSRIPYHERQFIYIAKDINTLAGCYSESIPWLFTIDQLPRELEFPVGHPQPNALYYAHPAKNGYYLPIEAADEELFMDKVSDFKRLVQGLGATEISFHSLKGRFVFDAMSSELDIEGGGEYKGIGIGGGFCNERGKNNRQTQFNECQTVHRFNPTKMPYVPDDISWLSVDTNWQRLVKMRMDGNMLHYSIRISSKETMDVSESRMDSVKAAFKSFVIDANMSFSKKMEQSFQREKEIEWEISVTFKPLNEFVNDTEK